jgi:hypothetical protein
MAYLLNETLRGSQGRQQFATVGHRVGSVHVVLHDARLGRLGRRVWLLQQASRRAPKEIVERREDGVEALLRILIIRTSYYGPDISLALSQAYSSHLPG